MLAGRGRPDLAAHLRQNRTWQSLHGEAEIHTFTRQDLSEDATFYRTAHSELPKARRGLLVGMTARGGRLTMPIAGFLQALPSHQWDVLILRDRWRLHYRHGVHGLADTFTDLVHAVANLASAYRQTVALGTSMGGLPAIRLGRLAGLTRAVSIAGRPWDDVQRIGAQGAAVPAFDPLCACARPSSCAQWFVSAANHGKDLAMARRHAELWHGRVLALPALQTHHVLGEAWLSGQLPALLDLLLATTRQDASDPLERGADAPT